MQWPDEVASSAARYLVDFGRFVDYWRDESGQSMSDYEIVGPFQSHMVLVGGRQVPFLEAAPANGGIIRLTLDQRYGVDVPVADAEWLIPFIADCIAVAMGYTCHPRPGTEPVRSVPFPPVHDVEQLEATGGESPARW